MDINKFKTKIAKMFNGAIVDDVVINDEFGNVTATINGMKNVDCGFIEDFEE